MSATTGFAAIALLTLAAGMNPSYGGTELPVSAFSTGGHTVYHVRGAIVERGGERVVIGAAYDGAVLCFTPSGKRVWQADAGGCFPFDLCVSDLDGDGRDETLVASGDGALYAFGPDGRPLWRFDRTAPLYQVCAARQADGRCIVLTGGVDKKLYALSAKGELRGQIELPDTIRHLRAGDIQGQGRELVAMATTTGGLVGKLGLSLVDPLDLSRLWSLGDLGKYAPNSGRRFFSMALADLDRDGRQHILLSGSWGEQGKIYAFDGAGKQRFVQSDPRIPDVPYRMNLLAPVKLPADEFIIGQFGNVLIAYNMDGTCREVVTGSYAYASASFDPAAKTLYCASEVSGGDEVVAVRLDRPGWQQAFAELKPVGKLATILANLQELQSQVARFQRPAYQPEPRCSDVLLLDEYRLRPAEDLIPGAYDRRHLRYVAHVNWGQEIEPGELWCRYRSAFTRYGLTADGVEALAKEWEARGRDFVLQAGHTTAMHMPLSTFERVLRAAPKHLWGFEFSEIGEDLDAEEREVVEKIMVPLLELCRQADKKVLLRTKNIFWNGNVYMPFLKNVLLDPRYRAVLIPCLEETNSRTQELSLAGRIGLWQSGAYERWACRAETDNACFNRMWEWSSQQVFSHHLRNLVSCAAQGCDVYFNSIHQGPFSPALERQLQTFYDMLAKGVVYVPRCAELASLSEVALSMRSPPSPAFIRHGTNGHGYRYPADEHPPLVFDRLDCYWGGAPLAPDDFSRYVFGVQRRMCNFLPLTPYGMVAMVPETVKAGAAGRFSRVIPTDGQYVYGDDGRARGPAESRPLVEEALRQAVGRLPLRVGGAAHWSAARMDADHLRVTLVDPGYLDPADRGVEIVLQQDGWTQCRDILRDEDLPVREGKVKLRIPMGALRIVDVMRKAN